MASLEITRFTNLATGLSISEIPENGIYEMDMSERRFDSREEFDVFVTRGAIAPVGATITPAFRATPSSAAIQIPGSTPLVVALPNADSVQVMADSFRTGARFCLVVTGMSAGSFFPRIVQ